MQAISIDPAQSMCVAYYNIGYYSILVIAYSYTNLYALYPFDLLSYAYILPSFLMENRCSSYTVEYGSICDFQLILSLF